MKGTIASGRCATAYALIISLLTVFSCASSAAGAKSDSAELKVVYSEGFESSNGGWTARGGERVAQSDKAVHTGKRALLVANRTGTWNGPIRDVSTTMKPGQTYKIGVWIMYPEGAESQAFSITSQLTIDGVGQQYTTIGADKITRGEWALIEAEYSVPKSKYETPLSIYFETQYKSADATKPEDLMPFYVDDVTITRLPPMPPPKVETDIPAFKDYFPELEVGAAMDYAHLDPQNINHGLLRHFGALVYGNEMKQDALQPQEGKFNFAKADALMAYAAKTGQKVRGHVLVWHNQVPAWLFKSAADENVAASREELMERIKAHITTVVSRYKGKVYSWDVVNEAVAENGELRDSKYLQIIGSDEYIAQAFRWAKEADPDAVLVLNDYNTEYSGPKQEGFFHLAEKLLSEGVPIDAIGLQCHIAIGRPAVYDIRDAIRKFASLGVKVQITELDISIYADGSEAKKAADRDILMDQANKYRDLFVMFREEAKLGHLDMVMLWGLADLGTWLDNHPTPGRTDYPLLFGKDLRAKPAYWAIVDPEKLPVYIQKIEAYRVPGDTVTAEEAIWSLVSPREITDRKGNDYGSFKLAWTQDALLVRIDVKDASADPADMVELYLEPKNVKAEKLSDNVRKVSAARVESIAQNDAGYTVLTKLAFGGNGGKLDAKIGFDFRIVNGAVQSSWNDLTNSQDASSLNYGTITLKNLPPLTYAKRGTVKIDGRIDTAWNDVEPILMETKTSGFTEDGSLYRTLWDDEFLYVLFEVKDQFLNDKNVNAYEQDSIEVFIDQNNAKSKTYESDDAQYRVSFRNFQTFNGGAPDNFKSASRIYIGGYLVETAIPWTHLKPEAGLLVGFDTQINEADASGTRAGIRNWVNDTNEGYRDTSGLGMLMLRE